MSEAATLDAPGAASAPLAAPNPAPPPAPEGPSFTPSDLKQASQRADDLIRSLQQNGQPLGAPGPAGEVQTPGGVASQGGAGDGATVVAVPTVPDAKELAALKAQLEQAQQEARTWKGRHDAETAREKQRIAELEAELNAVAREKREATKAQATQPLAATPLSDDEIESYGKDLMDVVARHASAAILPSIESIRAGLRAELDEIREQLGLARQAAAKTEWEKFLDRMEKRLPDWQKIDRDPGFKDWLDGVDPMYGVGARRKAIDDAAGQLDDARAAQVFEAFLSQKGASGSQGRRKAKDEGPIPGTEVPPTALEAPSDQPSLMDLAAPGGPSAQVASDGNAHGAPPGSRIWTVAEIQSFYRERSRNAYRDRPQEADRIEREIAQAQRDGRVRQ